MTIGGFAPETRPLLGRATYKAMMKWIECVVGTGAALLLGCAQPKAPVEPLPVAPPLAVAPPILAKVPETPHVVLVEPYLTLVELKPSVALPPSLGGRVPFGGQIDPLPSVEPIAPPPPTETRPIAPPPSNPPPASPRRSTPLPASVVRLFEDERARSVETAKAQVTSAAARVAQTSAEAKKTSELVRAGALAQFKADQADAAARSAVAEKADADRALEEAQERRRNARRDLEAAFGASALTPGFEVVALPTVKAFQPVPFTYRLSILGTRKDAPKIVNGTLGRPLPASKGEAGAWIVRCTDPSRLRVLVDAREATVVVHTLPSPPNAPPRV